MRGAPGYGWVNEICALGRGNILALAEITEVEMASTLNQMKRGGLLKARRRDAHLDAFWDEIDHARYEIIPISSSVLRTAADLCGRHPLKGYDAVQLACALSFRDDARVTKTTYGDPIFLSEDKRLIAAATAEGFTTDNPAAH